MLREEGMKDFSQYLAVPGTKEEDLMPDFFLDEFLALGEKKPGNSIYFDEFLALKEKKAGIFFLTKS